MIAELIATAALIVDYSDDHPELVKMLAGGLRDLLKGHAGVAFPSLEAQRALAAGMAADRAQAVQAYERAKPIKVPVKIETQQQLEDYCAQIGRGIKRHLLPPGIGFALLLFDFGPAGSLAYVSNAERENMIKVLAEFRAKLIEGRQ